MKRMMYLYSEANEIDNLLENRKKHIIKAANIKKYPFKMIDKDDTIYFLYDDGKGIVSASGIVKEAIFLELKDRSEREQLLEQYKNKILLPEYQLNYIQDRKYISILEITDIKKENAKIDHSLFGKVEDWITLIYI